MANEPKPAPGIVTPSEKEREKAQQLLRELVDIDWCIGYELTEEMQAKIDDIRTRAALTLEGIMPHEKLELRRMDTPENRAFWASVKQAAADWERLKPEWARRLEAKQRADLVNSWTKGAEHAWVFPPSANGGQYSIELKTVGAIMDVLKEVAAEDDPVTTIKRLAAQGIATPAVSHHQAFRELFIQGFEGQDPLLREFYYKDEDEIDAKREIKCMDCDAVKGDLHRRKDCRVGECERLLATPAVSPEQGSQKVIAEIVQEMRNASSSYNGQLWAANVTTVRRWADKLALLIGQPSPLGGAQEPT